MQASSSKLIQHRSGRSQERHSLVQDLIQQQEPLP
ncbi:unnamed protein product, partial [Rotaria sp. Silwood2]